MTGNNGAAKMKLSEGRLHQQDYLIGNAFTVADAYLYTLLRWLLWFSIDLKRWPTLVHYQARIAARPSAQMTLATELNGASPRTLITLWERACSRKRWVRQYFY